MHTLQPPYQIQSPGSVFQTDQVCRDVKVEIQKVNFLANLIVINSVGIDVILGMVGCPKIKERLIVLKGLFQSLVETAVRSFLHL